ncbi:MAG: M16 family metallopeptidase [Saprospiraceae bacterium]
MVNFERLTLANGLRVIAHEDRNTPLAALNIQYDVGSRDESPERTGFAHLFEHLMFSGSKGAPQFDEALQQAGGENNAFTTNDYTTFYDIVPAENLETALWLESDRMYALNIGKRAFKVQQLVVLEEFEETCLNEPYGDSWHHLSELAFCRHPYRWPVIGLKPEHIAEATHEEVKAFYKQWYGPNNAVLSVAGPLAAEQVFAWAEKWFGDIPPIRLPDRSRTFDPPLSGAPRRIVRSGLIPAPALYIAFRSPARLDPDFYGADLLCDVLAGGHASRLYRRLVKEEALFSSIDAYTTGNTDPGLLVIEGRLSAGVSMERAEQAVWRELHALTATPISESELLKVKRKFENTVVFSETSILNKAQNLAYYESLCRAEWMNEEVDAYLQIEAEHLRNCALRTFVPDSAVTLIYQPQ